VDLEDQGIRPVALGREQESIQLETVGRSPCDALGAADQAPRVVVSCVTERGDRPIRVTVHDRDLRRSVESLAHEREAVFPERCRIRRPGAHGVGRRPQLVSVTRRRVDVADHSVPSPESRVGEASVSTERGPGDVCIFDLDSPVFRPVGVHDQDAPGDQLAVTARSLDRRDASTVRRARREPELHVALGDHPLLAGRGVDQHERRGVPRGFSRILRGHRDHGAVAAPGRFPDVQIFA
jgi:hypothetical protein